MRIAFLTKKRDACYAIRIMTPSSHLVMRGHEIQEDLLELQEYCQKCKSGVHEYNFYNDAPSFRCPRCNSPFAVDAAAWKQNIKKMIEWADIVVFQRTTDIDHLKLMNEVKRMGKPVVLEADDNYIEVPQWNTGYQYYSQRRGTIEEMFRIADAVTVTTEGLRSRYLEFNPDVTILQNCIDIEVLDVEPKFPDIAAFNKKGMKISLDTIAKMREGRKLIGWGGSPTHEKDLELIVKALLRVARNEKVIFGFVGYVHRAIVEKLPEDQLILFGLVPVSHYFSLYKTIGFDIGLAPVTDVKFNEGKSPNKLIEYHALRVLPVASDFVTYRDYINRGYLAKKNDEYGWYVAMSAAATCDDAERKERIESNRKYAEENFDIKNKVHLWEECYQRVIDKKGSKRP